MTSGLSVQAEPLAPAEWDRYTDTHPGATPYHLRAWSEAVERALGHRTSILVARTGDAVSGILPLFRVAPPWGRPFVVSPAAGNHAGPIGQDSRVEDALVEEAIRWVRAEALDHLEVRSLHPLRIPDLVAGGQFVTFIKALDSSPDALFERLPKRVRHAVRKGAAQGLDLTVGRKENDLRDFMSCYRENMDALGSPPFGEDFFAALVESFGDRAMIVVARSGGTAVGADFIVTSRRMASPIFGGLTRAGRELSANYAITWRSIEEAARRGLVTYDLGRSTPGTGSAAFKSKWGATEIPLHYGFFMSNGGSPPDRDPRRPLFRCASRLWRLMPAALRWRIGPRLVKYLL